MTSPTLLADEPLGAGMREQLEAALTPLVNPRAQTTQS